jgi:hypothetical protein
MMNVPMNSPPSEVEDAPTAKIKTKTAKSKTFKGLSIYVGIYELLVTGGYISNNNSNSVIPFLGSYLSFSRRHGGFGVCKSGARTLSYT